MPTPREILDKLIQNPEFRKYPHSYNPRYIDLALKELAMWVRSRKTGANGRYNDALEDLAGEIEKQ